MSEGVPVVLPAKRCANCGRLMVSRAWAKVHDWGSAGRGSVADQLGKAGVRQYADSFTLGPLCRECAAAAAGHFTCALCGVVRTSDLRHESWGDPPDIVCEQCYETVPAKRWEAFVAEMEKLHRYDYE